MNQEREIWPQAEGRDYNKEPVNDSRYDWNDRIKIFCTFNDDDVPDKNHVRSFVSDILNIMGEDVTPKTFTLEAGAPNTFVSEARFHGLIPDGTHIKSLDFFRMNSSGSGSVMYQTICSRVLYLSGNPVLRIKTVLPEVFVFDENRKLTEVRKPENSEDMTTKLKPGISLSYHHLSTIPHQDPSTVHPRDFYFALPLVNWASRLEGPVERDSFDNIKRGESQNNRNVRNRKRKY